MHAPWYIRRWSIGAISAQHPFLSSPRLKSKHSIVLKPRTPSLRVDPPMAYKFFPSGLKTKPKPARLVSILGIGAQVSVSISYLSTLGSATRAQQPPAAYSARPSGEAQRPTEARPSAMGGRECQLPLVKS
mmetsp:Transcript_3938/g.7244  ORF Transcript_3938/g.7244 Transcript_3938/m.7244 type:complete len:131 (-) Transcript_3938:357-749(-)